jgi:pimeloyl-ACP methyl ester carboxylesterase
MNRFILLHKNNKLALFFTALLILSFSTAARSSVEEATLPNGLIVSAEYRQGNNDKPAILLLHGLLSTRNFLTVSSLTSALADDGYTVLAPNLSLGVSRRKVSLACEAIHTHTMQDDLAEIDFWVKWLVKHGHHYIVLVGHSYGSLHGLLYTLKYKNSAVKKLIATSLVDVEHVVGEQLSQSQIKMARDMVARNDNSLKAFQLSYCKKYVAPPKAFLSYAIWSKQRILDAISKTKVPVAVILGSADTRMGNGWPNMLKNSGVKVQIIKGANHFFHNEQEFDLLDNVLADLKLAH